MEKRDKLLAVNLTPPLLFLLKKKKRAGGEKIVPQGNGVDTLSFSLLPYQSPLPV